MLRFIAPLLLIFTMSANAQADSTILLACDSTSNGEYLLLTTADEFAKLVKTERTTRPIPRFNTAALLNEPEQINGRTYRTGSKVKETTCGQTRIDMKQGYTREEVFSERGGENFPLVKLHREGETLLDWTALGTCEMQPLVWGKCPTDWATSVEIIKDGNDAISIELHRSQIQVLDIPLRARNSLKAEVSK